MIDGDSGEQVEILRAEFAELRQRLELYREAFGECIGQCGEGLIAHVETLVRKLEDAFFTALDKRLDLAAHSITSSAPVSSVDGIRARAPSQA